MSRALVEAVAARIESVVSTNRTVYRHAVPDAPATRYIVVRSNIGEDESANFGDVIDTRSPVVWVTSVASATTDQTNGAAQAAAEAMWGAEKARDALMGWRSTIGAQRWKPVHLTSQPVARDDDRPDVTTQFTVDTFGFQYQP